VPPSGPLTYFSSLAQGASVNWKQLCKFDPSTSPASPRSPSSAMRCFKASGMWSHRAKRGGSHGRAKGCVATGIKNWKLRRLKENSRERERECACHFHRGVKRAATMKRRNFRNSTCHRLFLALRWRFHDLFWAEGCHRGPCRLISCD